jgi:hypothetical protein
LSREAIEKILLQRAGGDEDPSGPDHLAQRALHDGGRIGLATRRRGVEGPRRFGRPAQLSLGQPPQVGLGPLLLKVLGRRVAHPPTLHHAARASHHLPAPPPYLDRVRAGALGSGLGGGGGEQPGGVLAGPVVVDAVGQDGAFGALGDQGQDRAADVAQRLASSASGGDGGMALLGLRLIRLGKRPISSV